MSTTYVAHTIIGTCVSRELFLREVQQKPGKEDFDLMIETKLGKYDIIAEDDKVFVAMVHMEKNNNQSGTVCQKLQTAQLVELGAKSLEFQSYLQRMGVYTPDTFGIHTVITSY